MRILKRGFITLSVLLVLAGCTKKGIIGNCEKGDYEGFLHRYPEQCILDSLRGNGAFEVWRDEMDYSGNFSLFYHDASSTWGIDFYGFFGMMLSSVRIKGDSFSIFSPFLDRPMKGLVHNFNTETYIGIPLDAHSIQLLTTGRAPFDPSITPSECMKKNGLLSITHEIGNLKNTILWSSDKGKVERFTSSRKDRNERLEVAFKDYRDASAKTLPYTITFTYRGREEAYLKLNYTFIEAK